MLIGKILNKGSTFDKKQTLLSKKMSHILASVISELIKMSIMEGIFPSCIESGRVIPIFKSGKKHQATNYRPITTLLC